MTKILIDRSTVEQALEALEGGADSWQRVGPAIDALRAALVEDAMPLTEEEIKRLVSNDMVQFARAIERAHGIGGQP